MHTLLLSFAHWMKKEFKGPKQVCLRSFEIVLIFLHII